MNTDTKEMMKQFMEAIRKKGKVYEKKQISLRKINLVKFCPNCEELVTIEIEGLYGFCTRCNEKLYTIRNNEKRLNLNKIEMGVKK